MRALAASVVLAGAALAQDPSELAPESYRATTWTIANGLPQGSINDLLQTREGALWAATFGGLVRFDGLEFKVYDLESLPAMPSSRVTALAPDGGDGLWIALQSGHLLHFRDGRALAVERIPGTDMEPLVLLRPMDGALWVQCVNGAVLRFAESRWTLLVPAVGGGSYEGLCLNRDGSVSVAAGQELVVFEADGKERTRVRAPGRILALATGDSKGPWIGLDDGLAHLGEHGIERVPMTLRPEPRIQCILPGSGGDLWLGTSDGPVHLLADGDPTNGLLVYSSDPFPAIGVRALLRDSDGNIWVGADGFGLVRLRPHRLASFGPVEWRTGVTALAGDGEGGAWVGRGCNGLSRLLDRHWLPDPVDLPSSPGQGNCIESLLLVLRLDLRVSSRFLPVLEDAGIAGVIGPMLATGPDDVWVSTVDGQLLHVGKDDRVLERFQLDGQVHSLAAAGDGSLWVGGDGTLRHIVQGVVRSVGGAGDLPRGVLRDILIEPDGGLWVASYGGGLGYLKDGIAVILSRAQGLPDNSLSAIRVDDMGRFWILANQGLLIVRREELLDVVRGRASGFVPVVLGTEAGMLESEYGTPAAIRDSAGRLWFGTIGGPVRIDPRDFPANQTPPEARIERLRADDVALPCRAGVPVPALTRRLVLEYTAFALTASDRTRFRYQLSGLDEHWIEAGAQRWVAFTALGPGTYTFQVAARNEDGIWSERPARLEFEVLPAWWQTSTFRIAVVLAGALLLLLAHRRRVEGRRCSSRPKGAHRPKSANRVCATSSRTPGAWRPRGSSRARWPTRSTSRWRRSSPMRRRASASSRASRSRGPSSRRSWRTSPSRGSAPRR